MRVRFENFGELVLGFGKVVVGRARRQYLRNRSAFVRMARLPGLVKDRSVAGSALSERTSPLFVAVVHGNTCSGRPEGV